MKLVLSRLVAVFVVCVTFSLPLRAVEVVYRLPAEAVNPVTSLVAGADGAYYGTTRGLKNDSYEIDLGEAIRVTAAGEVSVIGSFDSSVGGKPSGLFLGNDGDVYGTTMDGGTNSKGALFRINPHGSPETVSSATEPGKELAYGFVQGDDGFFYGITRKGGGANRGAIFRISPDGRRSVLASFSDLKTEGAYPSGPLLKGASGVLIGACAKGGVARGGVLFEVSTAGVLSMLHSFDAKREHTPKLLLRAADGSLYGTVWSRSTRNIRVFRRAPTGAITYWDAPGVETLTEGADGHLYATARRYYWDYGKILRLTADGNVTELVEFDGSNGDGPLGLVSLPGDAGLLGITRAGGNTGEGVLVRLSYAGEFTLLHSFGSTRGHYLHSGLARGADGDFYGVMQEGGLYGRGTIFRLTSDGNFTVLHAFNGDDGAYPGSALLAASDGALYGKTKAGGANSDGTIFKITPAGEFALLHSFSRKSGSYPAQALIEGTGGVLYGTTSYGGKNGSGCVYKLPLTGGAPQVIASFPSSWGAGDDGCLGIGADGNLYGLGYSSSFYSHGPTVFYRVTQAGELKVLRKLSPREGTLPSGLTRGPDGNFYGTCRSGGVPFWGAGTIFRITPEGQMKVLRSYSFMNFEAGGNPSQLTLGSDGNFYGTTGQGGFYGSGYVFRLTAEGEYTKLRSIDAGTGSSDGNEGSVHVEGADGNLYGNHHYGFVYKLPKEPRENRAPYGNEDRFFIDGAKSATLSVLENDLELDGDPVEITAVTQGSGGVVEISGDKRSLVYRPGSGFNGVDQFSYELSDGKGGMATGNVTVQSWTDLRATYSLPLRGDGNGDVVGRLELRISGNGVFTGKAFVSGRVVNLRGKLNSRGVGIVNSRVPNGSSSMIVFVGEPDETTGFPTLYGGFSNYSFSGGRVVPDSDLAGRYTVLMEVPEPHPAGPALPHGRGWGVMSVETNGSVITKGQLPDGTPFSSGGWLSASDRWTFCASSGRHSLAFGEMIFSDLPQESDASATLTWSSGARWRGAFPLGFQTDSLKLIASRYTPRANGALPLAFGAHPAKADVVLRAGDIGEDYAAEVSFVNGTSAVVSGLNLETKLRIGTFGRAEGLWSGSFFHPEDLKQKRSFKGVIFQKQNRAEALFIDRTQTGRVTLEPR